MNPPGSTFLYSDINFIVLGELVQRVSGMPLNQYAQTYVFGPLGMTTTRFNPPQILDCRASLPRSVMSTPAQILRGVVHDPTARAMGGVAGMRAVLHCRRPREVRAGDAERRRAHSCRR